MTQASGIIECKAAVAWEAGKPLTIETIQVHPPKKGEVRVKLYATGVCHTDHYTWSGQDSEGVFPCILGHEGAGIVESVGPDVTSLVVGDTVIPLYIPECRNCKFCLSGKTNLCSVVRETQGKGLMPDGTTRFTCRDQPIYHYMGTSTFSEYTVCLEISLAKIQPEAPLDKVCLLGCGITTGYGAATRTAHVDLGSTVAVFGLGAVGLSVIQGAKACGAKQILAIDINPSKFDLARKLGATDTLNPNELGSVGADLKEALIKLSDGGFDYTFECIGNPATMRVALEACHKGWGQSIIIGVAAAGQEIATRPFQLVTGRVWKGSAFGGIKGRSELPSLVQAYLDHTLNIDDYVTTKFPLTGINEAMHEVGKSIRSIVYFNEKDAST